MKTALDIRNELIRMYHAPWESSQGEIIAAISDLLTLAETLETRIAQLEQEKTK